MPRGKQHTNKNLLINNRLAHPPTTNGEKKEHMFLRQRYEPSKTSGKLKKLSGTKL
jgi:hypothetical protein